MLLHLITAMDVKNISTLALAQLIGTTEKTAYNKIRGITDFTMPEAVKIKVNMFPEYDLCYLFEPVKEEVAV